MGRRKSVKSIQWKFQLPCSLEGKQNLEQNSIFHSHLPTKKVIIYNTKGSRVHLRSWQCTSRGIVRVLQTKGSFTVFTTVHLWFACLVKYIQATNSPPYFNKIHFNIIFHLCLIPQTGRFSLGLTVCYVLLCCACYMPRPSHLPLLDYPSNICEEYKSWSSTAWVIFSKIFLCPTSFVLSTFFTKSVSKLSTYMTDHVTIY